MEHTKTRRTCDDCSVTWDRKNNLKDIVLCPLHASAPELLKALEDINATLAPTTLGTNELSVLFRKARDAIQAAKP